MDVPVRLAFLAEIVQAKARHLRATDARLFSEPMTPQRAARMHDDLDLSERAVAFVARFGRLQDTLAADKLLPELRRWLAESVGAAIDNLNRAERLGWIASVEQWLVVRRLRNRMIQEYERGLEEWAAALTAGHAAVGLLEHAAQAMVRRIATG